MLPVANVRIEHYCEVGRMDSVFAPQGTIADSHSIPLVKPVANYDIFVNGKYPKQYFGYHRYCDEINANFALSIALSNDNPYVEPFHQFGHRSHHFILSLVHLSRTPFGQNQNR